MKDDSWKERIAASGLSDVKTTRALAGHLLGLVAENPDVRAEALDALYGLVYEEAPGGARLLKALPIVVDMVSAKAGDRGPIATFLRSLLGQLPRNESDGFVAKPKATPAALKKVEHEIARAQASFIASLEDAEARSRGSAAALLALLADGDSKGAEQNQLTAAVAAAIEQERDDNALSSLLVAAGLMTARLRVESLRAPLQSALGRGSPLVRVAAACGLLRSEAPAKTALPDDLRAALEGAPDPLSHDDFPWGGGDPAILVAEALAFACTGTGPKWSERERSAIRVLRPLLKARAPFRELAETAVTAADVMLAKANGQPVPEASAPISEVDRAKNLSVTPLTATLLAIGFRAFDGSKQKLERAALSDEQVDLLRFLAFECKVDGPYRRFGLPFRREMADFVDGA